MTGNARHWIVGAMCLPLALCACGKSSSSSAEVASKATSAPARDPGSRGLRSSEWILIGHPSTRSLEAVAVFNNCDAKDTASASARITPTTVRVSVQVPAEDRPKAGPKLNCAIDRNSRVAVTLRGDLGTRTIEGSKRAYGTFAQGYRPFGPGTGPANSTIRVPKIIGLRFTDAKAVACFWGLHLESKGTRPTGIVSSQSPSAGTRLPTDPTSLARRSCRTPPESGRAITVEAR